MRPLTLSLVFVLAGCGGATAEPTPSVVITHASVRDGGRFTVEARIEAVVRAGPEGGVFELWAGVWWPNGQRANYGCERSYVGWRLELDPSDAELRLGPHEVAHVSLRARSYRSPTCAPRTAVATCGELVTVVLVPDGHGDGAGAFETRYECDLQVLQPG